MSQGHELGWLLKPAYDILAQTRNFIHFYKYRFLIWYTRCMLKIKRKLEIFRLAQWLNAFLTKSIIITIMVFLP